MGLKFDDILISFNEADSTAPKYFPPEYIANQLNEAIVDIFNQEVDKLISKILTKNRSVPFREQMNITKDILDIAKLAKKEDEGYHNLYRGQIAVVKIPDNLFSAEKGATIVEKLLPNQNIIIEYSYGKYSRRYLRHEIIHAVMKIKPLVLRKTERPIKSKIKRSGYVQYMLSDDEIDQVISKFVSKFRNRKRIPKFKSYIDLVKYMFDEYISKNLNPFEEMIRIDIFSALNSDYWKKKILRRLAREGYNFQS